MRTRITFGHIAPILLFIFFTSYTLAIRFDIGAFLTPDDPFYHARMAHSLWTGEHVEMPRFSTQHTNPSNLYVFYHAAMAPFVGHCERLDYNCITRGSQVFHSVLVGLFAALAFGLFRRVLRRGTVPNADILAVILTILMFGLARQSLSRMLMERPIVWSLLFCAAMLAATLERKKRFVFAIPLLFVFSYSFSILILAPVGVYLISGLVFDRTDRKAYAQMFGLAVAGTFAGILLRPDAWNYVVNAYGSHLLSIYQSLTASTSILIPNEFVAGYKFSDYFGSIWFWTLFPAMLVLFVRSLFVRGNARAKAELVTVSAVALSFLGLFVVFLRAIDYIMFTSMFAIAYHIAHATQAFPNGIVVQFMKRRGILITLAIIALLSLTFVMVRPVISIRESASFNKYFNTDFSLITREIRKDYTEGDLVFAPGFGTYAKLIFFDPGITYPMGMDSSFTRLYDEKLFWQIQNSTLGRPICPALTCAPEDAVPFYDFMHDTLKAKYIIAESRNPKLAPFVESITSDTRFEKVFTFPDETGIELYKVTERSGTSK